MSATPETPPSGSPLKRLFVPAAVLFCLGGGVAGGIALWPHPKTEPVASPEPPKKPAPSADATRSAAEEAIRSLKFETALKLLAELPAEKPDPSAYLRGLALEGAGKYTEALAAYHLAADPDRDPADWAAAALGAVRAALADGNLRFAREWLARAELRAGHPACQGTRVLDECRVLRGRLDAARLGSPADPDPLDDTAAATAPFDLSGPYLDWLTDGWRVPPDDSTEAFPPAPPPPLPTGLRVTTVDGSPRVTGQLPDTRVIDVLKELARAASWTLKLPTDLNPSLTGASVAVAARDLPAADALVALTEPFGLRWRLDGDALVLFVDAEPAAPDAVPAAVASLARAAECHDHPHARAAAVRLATIYERLGRTADATARYARLLIDSPHASEAVHAGYNLGLLQLRTGRPEAARATFREVIDRGGKTRWTDLGWWWTGRTFLDAGDPAGAYKPLRHALAGKDRAARSAAVLGIVLCHVLQGNDATAHETLERHVLSAADPHARLARLFSEHLRHATAPTRGRSETLLAAVRAADCGRRFGPAGAYFAGRVYRDLGLTAKTVQLYETAITAGGPWAPRMTFAVGEILDDEDRPAEARPRLMAVAAVDTGDLGLRAEMRLADLDLRTGRPEEALVRCRRLLDRPGADESALLYLMGRAHEATGEPLRAAVCFSGRRPPD